MREEKAIAFAIIGITVLATLATLPVFAEATDYISVTYSFDESEILSWLDTGKPMKNLQVQAIGGEPLLPYRIAKILLPPYTEVADVSVQATFGGQHAVNDIPCGQQPCVIGEEPTIVEKNPDIYNSDELYPGIIYRVGSVDSFRGYNILHVRLYPVQYKPASKLAIYYTEMTAQVTLKAGGKMDTFRSLAKDRKIAETLVDNPWTLSTYDSIQGTMGTLSTNYEYLIITTVPLLDEFQELADWKAKWVDGARVETVSTGASAEEIKNVINDYYTYYGTSYVLLGGDVGVIPYHTKQVMGTDIAEDYWFANLVGDDDISFYEVYIGRAPVDNDAEAAHFVEKVISFEQMDKPTANLFHQSRVRTGNDPDSRELAWQCMQYVPSGYVNYTLFEEDGRIEKTDWISFWRNDGIMCEHIGHGSPTSYYINYEVGGGPVTWYDTDVPSMDNTFWPVHTSVACHSGEFEYEDCLAEAYVKDDHGAIACFMNDKYGWYMSNDATYFSGDFIEMQFHALYQEGYQNIGAILAHSKYHFIDEATNESEPYRAYWEWCWREINLIGDPETPVLTKRVLHLTVLAEDQYGNGLTTGYVYIDDQLVGNTGSTFTVVAGTHTVRVNDFWGPDGYRYSFTYWEDGPTDNPRTIEVVEDMTLTARYNRSVLKNWSFERVTTSIYDSVGWWTNNGGHRALKGDIWGPEGVPDGLVDIDDVSIVAAAYGAYPGCEPPLPPWNTETNPEGPDLNGDGVVDIDDVSIASFDFGKYMGRDAYCLDGAYSWYTSGGGRYLMYQQLDSDAIQAIAGKTVTFSFWFYPESVASDGSQNNALAKISYMYSGGGDSEYGVWVCPTELKWYNAYVTATLPSTTSFVVVAIHGKPDFKAWVDLAQLCLE